jgi:hypothetical protein
MFTLTVSGIEIRCDSAGDAAELVRALEAEKAEPTRKQVLAGVKFATRAARKARGVARDDLAAGFTDPPAKTAQTKEVPVKRLPPGVSKADAVATKKPRGGSGRRPSLTDSEITEIHARYMAGERSSDLCQEAGVSLAPLYNGFKRLGLPIKGRSGGNG